MAQKIRLLTDDPTINLVLDTISMKKQCIVFANTKKSAEKAAEDITKSIKSNNPEHEEIAKEAIEALAKPTIQCQRLSFCLKKGIAFHHAGLTHEQKELIEDNFRNGKIHVICSTPTLAYGLDLPAYRVVLKDLRRYSQRGLTFIPVLEYLQMAGRAGRPKYDKVGEAIAVCTSEEHKQKIIERYINGEPENIESKLAVEPVLRTYLLSLISSGFVTTKKRILDFFEKTFWAYHFEDSERLAYIIEKTLNMLIEWGFITSNVENDDFRSANDVKDEKYSATLIGKRVSELYIDPFTASEIIKSLTKAKKDFINAFSFLHVVASTLEIRPFLKVKVKEYEDIQSEILKYNNYLIKMEPNLYDPDYDDYLNGVKTAFMLNDWIEEKDEEFLLEKYSIRPGELRAKVDIADWLLYSTEELARLLKLQLIITEIRKTRIRLKHGAKEELLPLLQLREIGRVRARKMFNNGIKTIGDVKKVDFMKLSQLIGKATASKVKSEVGEPVPEPIKETKRKGQMSLGKF